MLEGCCYSSCFPSNFGPSETVTATETVGFVIFTTLDSGSLSGLFTFLLEPFLSSSQYCLIYSEFFCGVSVLLNMLIQFPHVKKNKVSTELTFVVSSLLWLDVIIEDAIVSLELTEGEQVHVHDVTGEDAELEGPVTNSALHLHPVPGQLVA